MTAALDILQAHQDKRRNRRIELPSITDTDGNPLVVWGEPITAYVREQIVKRAKGSEIKQNALIVIYLARDADGNPAFPDDAETMKALMHDVGPHDVHDIADRLLATDAPATDLGN